MKKIAKIVGQVFVLALVILIASKSIDYLDFKVKKVLVGREVFTKNTLYPIMFYLHVIVATVALIIGPFQFYKAIRDKYTSVHRNLGKVYVICCLMGSVTGFYLAFFTFGGTIATLGFVLLSIVWFYSVLRAYTAIINKNLIEHSIWMHRNYALTFAAVTLRLWIAIITLAFDAQFDLAYQIASWLCWIPNLIIIEIYLKNSSKYKIQFK